MAENRLEVFANKFIARLSEKYLEPPIDQTIPVRLIDVRHRIRQAIHRATQLSLATFKLVVGRPDVVNVGTDDIQALRLAIGAQVGHGTHAMPARPSLNGRHQTFVDHSFARQRPLHVRCGKLGGIAPQHFFGGPADDLMTRFATYREERVVHEFVPAICVDICN